MLDRDEIEIPLLEKRWEIDCVEMVLTQNDTSPASRFVGKGMLRQDEDGVICFKLFATQTEQYDFFRRFGDFGTPGKLIESSRYYSLVATDWFGRIWKYGRVYPEISASFHQTGPTHLITGKLHEIISEKEQHFDKDANYLRMVFFTDVKPPANAVTETITRFDGEDRRLASSFDLAKFRSSIGEFLIRTEEGQLIVECQGDKVLPMFLHVRMIESLSFVFGRRGCDPFHVPK